MSRPSHWVRLAVRSVPALFTRSGRRPGPQVRPALAQTLVASLALLGATGCATLDPPSPRCGGSGLTQAANEAKQDDDDKHVNLHAGRTHSDGGEAVVVVEVDGRDGYDEDEEYDEYFWEEPATAKEVDPGPPRPPFFMGLVAGTGSASGAQFAQHGLAGFQLGVEPMPRTRFGVSLIALPQRFVSDRGPLGGLDRPVELAVDLTARYDLTPGFTGPSVYPIVGVRLGVLLWDYHHPILIDGQKVGQDALDYLAPYAGIGTALLRTGAFEFGVNLTGGFKFYDTYTEAGLQNDLFRDAGFVQLALESTWRF
jgi:hypothetical protein